MTLIYLFSFLLSFSLTLYLTPRIAAAALKIGIVDKPDGKLKTHKKITPYLGGLAIYIPFILTLGITFRFDLDVFALLLSSTIILVLGLIDDFGAISPAVKLLGQAIAVFVLIKGGIYIQLVFMPKWVCIMLTFLWLMGITNAVNIIDIKDGLATGVVFTATVFLFIISVIDGNILIAIMTITFSGSLLGFLRFNWQPASIYLGDTGSMFLGFLVGALGMSCSYTQNNNIASLSPIILLGVPIFDTILVSLCRLRKGKSPLQGSPDHFAHRFIKIGWSLNRVVLGAYFVTAVFGILVLLLMGMENIWLATILVSAVSFAGIILLFLLANIKMKNAKT
jgi:UDP-GlcNAc:undecaprenyl-phosphate GlcNAc-1-phosphate transferase